MQWGFLTAYAAEIAGCVSFPDDLEQADAVLELCIIEKALYEVHYEIANRPDWISIPIAGLLAAIDGRTHSFGQTSISRLTFRRRRWNAVNPGIPDKLKQLQPRLHISQTTR